MRFSEFTGNWIKYHLKEIAEKVNNKNNNNKISTVFSNSAVQGIVLQSDYFDKSIANKENLEGYYIVEPFDFVYNPRLSSTAEVGAMSVNKTNLTGLVSPLYTVFRIKENNINIPFLEYLFKSKVWHNYMRSIANYGARDDRMNVRSDDFYNLPLTIPNFFEQNKISTFLSLIEIRIQTQRKIIEGLITLKIQSRNKLFKQIIKDDYEAFTVEEILNYEQPTKYIVSNTDYSSDKSLIPVLTANKAFILGYTNEDSGIYNKGKCIVLDDFTLDLKYVDFSFKIKSSAIKLLTPKNNVDLKFVFEYFSFLNLSSNEHKRHYISEIQPMLLNIPSIDIQNNISNFLSKLDAKINLETKLLTQYENQKKYLLQNLFV